MEHRTVQLLLLSGGLLYCAVLSASSVAEGGERDICGTVELSLAQ